MVYVPELDTAYVFGGLIWKSRGSLGIEFVFIC